MSKLYPVNVDIKVHITNGDVQGVATYGFPLHNLPTEADMPKVMESVLERLPKGFRLMTRHESMMYFLREEKGYRGSSLALPRLDDGDEWHDPENANTISFDDDYEDEE